MSCKIHIWKFLLVLILLSPSEALAGKKSKSTVVTAYAKFVRSPPAPEQLSEWFPADTNAIRYNVGFIPAKETLIIRAPFKVSFSYNPGDAIAGRWVDLKVKILPQSPSGKKNLLEATHHMKISAMTEINTGTQNAGWHPLDIDLWDMLSESPPLSAKSAKVKDGVEYTVKGRKFSPMGDKVYEFTNKSDLVKIRLKKPLTKAVTGRIEEKILAGLPADVKAGEKEEKTENTLADSISNLFPRGEFRVWSNTAYEVSGKNVIIHLTTIVDKTEGGKQKHTLVFSRPGEECSVRVYIPKPDAGKKYDYRKLRFFMDRLDYQVTVKRKRELGFESPSGTFTPHAESIIIFKGFAVARGGFDFDSPVRPLPPDVGLRIRPSDTSVYINWNTPETATKGTVNILKGKETVRAETEDAFAWSHDLLLDGLKPDTRYKVILTAEGKDGKITGPVNYAVKTNAAGREVSFKQEEAAPKPAYNVKVLDDAGQPVKTHPVQVFEGDSKDPVFTVLTGKTGETAFMELEAGKSYRFTSGGNCFIKEAVSSTKIEKGAQGNQGTIKLELKRKAPLKGSVYDAVTMKPLNGVSISVQYSSGKSLTDDAGAYSISGLNPGEVRVTLKKDGYVKKEILTTVNDCGHLIPPDAVLFPVE